MDGRAQVWESVCDAGQMRSLRAALVKGPPAQGVLLGPLGLLSALPLGTTTTTQGRRARRKAQLGPLWGSWGTLKNPQGLVLLLQRHAQHVRASHIDRC